MKRSVVITIVSLLAVSCPAAAQSVVQLSAGASLAGVRSVADESGARRVSDGTALGGAGEVRFGDFVIGVNYLEGTIHAKGTTSDVGYVAGSATASVRLNPWLRVGTTVRVHRIDEVQPERWLFWGARAALDLPIMANTLRGRAVYAQGLGGSVNLPYGGIRGRSGEVGLTWRLPGQPFMVDLATSVEGNEAGSRSRTVQQLVVTVGWGGR